MPKEGFATLTIKTETIQKVKAYVKKCKERGIKTSVPKEVTKAIDKFVAIEGN